MTERRHSPRGRSVVLILAGVLLAVLATAAPASAHANLDRSEPAAGIAIPTAPAEIRLTFTEPVEPRYSGIEVYDSNRQRYGLPTARLAEGDAQTLIAGVKDLPQGVYTVVWKANSADDGHTTTGSFAFSVGSVPPPPADGDVGGTAFTTPTPAEIAVKWLALLAVTAFTGTLGLRLLVWGPALRPGQGAEATSSARLEAPLSRRLTLLAGAALPVLLGTTVAGLLLQVGKATGKGIGGALDGAVLGDFLLGTRTGAIWAARLLLPIAAAILLGPLIVRARRDAAADRPAGAESGATASPLAFGIALGAAYLLTISLISHAAASPLWTPFTIAVDWVHLLATAVWVGGLAGLVATLPLLRGAADATPLLLRVITRFSSIAMASVAALTLSGLYSAWLHVGSLDALLPTEYGRALVVKLVLVAGLVASGALNLFWLRPRVEARARQRPPSPGAARGKGGKRAPDQARAAAQVGATFLRTFGRVVGAEALVGVAILLAVAVLTGFVPAREAIVQARAPKRAQTIAAGDLRLTLTLNLLQPGENSFDVLVKDRRGNPVPDAERVALRITHAEMDMGEAEAIAAPRGDGHYAASGPYLAMSGKWNIRAIVRRASAADVEGTFQFPVGSTANLVAKPSQPQPPQLNSPRGIGFVSLGIGLVLTFFGVQLFRRGSGFGTALLMLVPTALVVGGYLVYKAQC